MVALGFLSLPLSPLAYMALSTISCAAWLAGLEPFQSLPLDLVSILPVLGTLLQLQPCYSPTVIGEHVFDILIDE